MSLSDVFERNRWDQCQLKPIQGPSSVEPQAKWETADNQEMGKQCYPVSPQSQDFLS